MSSPAERFLIPKVAFLRASKLRKRCDIISLLPAGTPKNVPDPFNSPGIAVERSILALITPRISYLPRQKPVSRRTLNSGRLPRRAWLVRGRMRLKRGDYPSATKPSRSSGSCQDCGTCDRLYSTNSRMLSDGMLLFYRWKHKDAPEARAFLIH